MPSQFSSRVTSAPDVMLRIIGDEAVILNLKSETYLGLDPVGTRIWTVLQRLSLHPGRACVPARRVRGRAGAPSPGYGQASRPDA